MNLTARLTLMMVALALSAAAAVGLFTYWNLAKAILPTELARMESHVLQMSDGLDEAVVVAHRDVMVFANGAASIEGIIRARLHGGRDPEGGTTEQVWRARLARRLLSDLKAKPDYLQFRIIDAVSGRELVRVERSGPSATARIVPDDELEATVDRDYLTAAMKLPAGATYLSRIDLQQKQGKIQVPHVPVIRLATPIFMPDGKPFALVVINVDLRATLAKIGGQEQTGGHVYVIDETGQYLWHAQAERTFGFQLGRDDRLQKDYPALASSVGAEDKTVRLIKAPAGESMGVAMLPLHPGGSGPWVAVVELVPEARLLAPLALVRHSSLVAAAGVGVLALALAAWLAHSLTKPLVKLTRSVESFATGQLQKIKVEAPGEIGRLGDAFDHMVAEVNAKTDALHQSETSLEAAQARAWMGSWERDLKTQTSRWSKGMFRLFDCDPSRGEPDLTAFLELIHPEDRPRLMETHRHNPEFQQPRMEEFRTNPARGPVRHINAMVECVRDQDGKPLRMVGTVIDITQRKEAEEEARLLTERLSLATDAAQIGIWDWALEEDVWYATSTYSTMLGYDPAEASADRKIWFNRIHPEDRAPVGAMVEALLAGKNVPFEYEARVQHADGSYRWAHVVGRVLTMDAQGRPGRILGVRMDITERKRAELALQQSREEFKDLFDNAPVGYHEVDVQGCLVRVNQAELKMLGYTADELLGQKIWKISADEEQSRLAVIDKLAGQQPGHAFERRFRRKDGSTFPVLVDDRLVRGTNGAVTCIRAIIQDITESKQTAEAIHLLNAALEQRVEERTAQLVAANQELEAFSYSVSHDLRTPLRAVDGFSQAVEEDFGGLLPDEGRRQLRTIRESAQRMGDLIDDLLEFSRLSRQPMNQQRVQVEPLVRSVFTDLNNLCAGRKIELKIGALPDCESDPALLKQVWLNLLSNALKYTRRRESAVVEVGCLEQARESVYFVRDNGSGFDMRYAGKLFGVFQRLHRAEDYEGTGVGLAIVQRIIHRHGGRIWAEAEPERGATFFFTLKGENKL